MRTLCRQWNQFIDFNSIKVRLKRMFLCKSRINSSTFQFHKGTIKTRIFNPVVSVAFEFQFHKGTIKTEVARLLPAPQQDFNSIKVRLKL